MLHVISLAQFSMAYTRGWAADGVNTRLRLKARVDQLEQEVALLREEIRIKDVRMVSISPHRRPQYSPLERMAILELRAAHCWSRQQTADTFLLTAATIGTWMKRVDEQGPDALLQIREPVNKFPDFVRYAVQRLKTLCPSMGKVKIAQTLSRAGLHLSATTVGRIFKERPHPFPQADARPHGGRVVTAREPNHVWHIDLTAVPIGSGFWCSWLPFAMPQNWPYCWGGGLPLDQLGRKEICELLDWVYEDAAAKEGRNPGRTANKVRSHLRALMSWAWEQDLVDARRVSKFFGQRQAAGYFTYEMIPLSKKERDRLPPPQRGCKRPECRFEFTYDNEAAKRDADYDGYSVLVTTAARTKSADLQFTKYKQQSYSELASHELKTPLAVHPVFLKSPRRVEALVFLLMVTLTLYFLIQRLYRQNVPKDAPLKEQHTTTQTILRAFNRYTLIIHRTRLGREVQPTRLTTRQRQILQQLGFDTPAQILSRKLPRAP
jgi:hypothetical protein